MIGMLCSVNLGGPGIVNFHSQTHRISAFESCGCCPTAPSAGDKRVWPRSPRFLPPWRQVAYRHISGSEDLTKSHQLKSSQIVLLC